MSELPIDNIDIGDGPFVKSKYSGDSRSSIVNGEPQKKRPTISEIKQSQIKYLPLSGHVLRICKNQAVLTVWFVALSLVCQIVEYQHALMAHHQAAME